jgi:hypothetical protein
MDNKEKPEVKPGNRKKWPVPISYKTPLRAAAINYFLN